MKNTNTKGLIITIIILIFGIIGLSGYIIYDKFLNNSKNISEEIKETTEQNQIDNNSNANNTNKAETTTEQNQIDNNSNTNNTNKAETTTEQNQTENTKTKKCYGTYYINGNANEGIYKLNENGTFTVENQEVFGVYVIHQNTITFIYAKHTVGPINEVAYYGGPQSFLIYDDCSQIRLTNSENQITGYLKKVN